MRQWKHRQKKFNAGAMGAMGAMTDLNGDYYE